MGFWAPTVEAWLLRSCLAVECHTPRLSGWGTYQGTSFGLGHLARSGLASCGQGAVCSCLVVVCSCLLVRRLVSGFHGTGCDDRSSPSVVVLALVNRQGILSVVFALAVTRRLLGGLQDAGHVGSDDRQDIMEDCTHYIGELFPVTAHDYACTAELIKVHVLALGPSGAGLDLLPCCCCCSLLGSGRQRWQWEFVSRGHG